MEVRREALGNLASYIANALADAHAFSVQAEASGDRNARVLITKTAQASAALMTPLISTAEDEVRFIVEVEVSADGTVGLSGTFADKLKGKIRGRGRDVPHSSYTGLPLSEEDVDALEVYPFVFEYDGALREVTTTMEGGEMRGAARLSVPRGMPSGSEICDLEGADPQYERGSGRNGGGRALWNSHQSSGCCLCSSSTGRSVLGNLRQKNHSGSIFQQPC